MFLSAVSAGLVLTGAAGDQVNRLNAQEQQVWKRMEPRIVTVLQNGRPTGAAALIDTSGLFVAHRNAVLADMVQGRMSDGRTVQMTVKGQDSLTQLVLLQVADWDAGSVQAFLPPMVNERPGGALLAVLPSGPIRAEHVSSQRFGVVKPSNRMVPLSEFRFEAPAAEVGTALVFCENGEFLGALNATLGGPQAVGTSGVGTNLTDPRTIFNTRPIGPSGLTVAYTTGAQLTRRVLDGFKSESHEVQYPSLGVMCNDAIGGGAQVQKVVPNSPAAQAGVRFGDIIVDIAGVVIRNQVDFARVMLDQEVGKKIVVRIKRGSQMLFMNAVVAKAD
ncbi:MAG: PDZ domain-containing protein [Fimbriimonas sp.]